MQQQKAEDPNNTACLVNCCANCVDISHNGGPIYRFWQAGHADTLLLIKTGDVETNPGPTTTRKQV